MLSALLDPNLSPTSEACQKALIDSIPQYVEDSSEEEGERVLDIFGDYLERDWGKESRIDPEVFKSLVSLALDDSQAAEAYNEYTKDLDTLPLSD